MKRENIKNNFKLFLIIISMIITTACSSTYTNHSNKNNSSDDAIKKEIATSPLVWGSKPGNSKPQPQTNSVDIRGVKGAKLTTEKYSTRGNKDYKVLGKTYKVWRDVTSYSEVGIASWYGPSFDGKKTSNGEIYNMNGYSAAHKNLPLPSFLKVTNLSNNKSVIVRVNDRGPFHSNRIIDLSKGAAQALDVIRPGTAKVKIELIKTVPTSEQTSIEQMDGFKAYIQVFSTSDKQKAIEIQKQVYNATRKKTFIENNKNIYRIKVGPLKQSNREQTLKQIKNLGFNNAYYCS